MTAAPRVPRVPRPADEFEHVPADTGFRHMDRLRRVHVGPSLSLVFEDRQTLSFRMDELARYARLAVGPAVRRQVDWYRTLMPGGGRLTAAVWVGVPGRRPTAECAAVRRAVTGGRMVFRSDAGTEVEGARLRERVSDRLIGMAGWVAFRFTAAEGLELADARAGWRLIVEGPDHAAESAPLDVAVRRSLAGDLTSER